MGFDQRAGEQDTKPNIVLVLMDNLGWGELGVYGGAFFAAPRLLGWINWPAKDSGASTLTSRRSVRQAVAALLTGRYAVRTGNGTVPLFTPIYGLTQSEVTIASGPEVPHRTRSARGVLNGD